MTIHPSKVFYTLDTQIARYLDGDLGVYRPAIGPGRHKGEDSSTGPPQLALLSPSVVEEQRSVRINDVVIIAKSRATLKKEERLTR